MEDVRRVFGANNLGLKHHDGRVQILVSCATDKMLQVLFMRLVQETLFLLKVKKVVKGVKEHTAFI